MSDMRLGPWAVFGLGVMVSTVACVDGSVSAGPGAPESVSLGGSSGMGNAFAAGASGKSRSHRQPARAAPWSPVAPRRRSPAVACVSI